MLDFPEGDFFLCLREPKICMQFLTIQMFVSAHQIVSPTSFLQDTCLLVCLRMSVPSFLQTWDRDLGYGIQVK